MKSGIFVLEGAVDRAGSRPLHLFRWKKGYPSGATNIFRMRIPMHQTAIQVAVETLTGRNSHYAPYGVKNARTTPCATACPYSVIPAVLM